MDENKKLRQIAFLSLLLSTDNFDLNMKILLPWQSSSKNCLFAVWSGGYTIFFNIGHLQICPIA